MPVRQTMSKNPARRPGNNLPDVWLFTDARNDAALDCSVAALPRSSGIVFRHYHLGAEARHKRFERIRALAAARNCTVVLADSPRLARKWGADGVYGNVRRTAESAGLLVLATAHSLRELVRADADAVFLSPVFATRSHAGARALGRVQFALWAQRVRGPVFALGGMDRRRYLSLPECAAHGWGAIDGLTSPTG